jgi:2-hydroxychromene-2-carboxylate isomerase
MNVIEAYADIWCPFAHVGIRRVAERRDALGADVVLRVRPWPLELVNGRPMDAAFIADEVVDIRDQVAPELFTHFDEACFPTTTLPALALVEAAYDQGLRTGEAMSLALRDALFEEGRAIGDPEVLASIAEALGVPPAGPAHHEAVVAAWHDGQVRGVVGSPHFFTAGGAFFCPALDIRRVDGHLRIAPKAGMFDEFLAVAFLTAS